MGRSADLYRSSNTHALFLTAEMLVSKFVLGKSSLKNKEEKTKNGIRSLSTIQTGALIMGGLLIFIAALVLTQALMLVILS